MPQRILDHLAQRPSAAGGTDLRLHDSCWCLPGHLEVRAQTALGGGTAGTVGADALRDHGRGLLPTPGVYSVSSRDTALAVMIRSVSHPPTQRLPDPGKIHPRTQ